MQPSAMQPSEFARLSLAGTRARLRSGTTSSSPVLGRLASNNPPQLLWWSLGEPGQCAIKAPGYPILLGDVNAARNAMLSPRPHVHSTIQRWSVRMRRRALVR